MKKQKFTLFYPWDPEGYKPEVTFELGMNGEGFTMDITVLESDPLREKTEHLQYVNEDSCVEWFVNFMPKKCEKYFNFEVNANGVMNVAVRKERANKTALSLEDIASLGIKTEICDTFWRVSYVVPFELIRKYIPEYRYEEGMTILSNFYKCGDKTVRPHYGVWNLIPLDKPDYHQPQYFGKIILQ